MPTMTVETEQLLEAALQLPQPELERFLTRLAAFSGPRYTPRFPPVEADLLWKINQGPSADVQERLDILIGKRESNMLTAEEYQELIRLTEAGERADVQRLEYLIELAAVRGVTVDEVMAQLGIKPRADG